MTYNRSRLDLSLLTESYGKLSLIPIFTESINEPHHDKSNKMACAPSEDSDQPRHLPGLIRVFAAHSMGSKEPKVSS